MTAASPPHVVIIVVNWNNHSDTLACLKSISELDYDSVETILIDNGSSAEDVAALRRGRGDVRLIELPINSGYVGGNNLGLSLAKDLGAEYALLLNNDAVVAPSLLSQLIREASGDKTVAVVGPTVYYFAQPELIWSAGGSIDWKRGRTSMLQRGVEDSEKLPMEAHPVDFVTGCALLVRMSVVEKVGPLDPRFFAYYEETEWCVRMARAGHRILQVPRAKVWHKIPVASDDFSPIVHYYMTRNRLLFLRLTGASLKAFGHALLVDNARTLVSWTFRPKWRHRNLHRSMMIKAIADFFLGRFGPYDRAVSS